MSVEMGRFVVVSDTSLRRLVAIGGPVGSLIAAISIVCFAVYLTSVSAIAQIVCDQVTVENCPTLFKDECNDPTFRSENEDACLNAIE